MYICEFFQALRLSLRGHVRSTCMYMYLVSRASRAVGEGLAAVRTVRGAADTGYHTTSTDPGCFNNCMRYAVLVSNNLILSVGARGYKQHARLSSSRWTSYYGTDLRIVKRKLRRCWWDWVYHWSPPVAGFYIFWAWQKVFHYHAVHVGTSECLHSTTARLIAS